MSKLEKTTHVLLIAVCLLSGTVLIRRQFFSNVGQAPGNDLVGKRISTSSLILPKKTVLVVAVRSDCRFCAESLPLYRELGRRGSSVPLFFLSSEPVEQTRRFADEAGVKYDGIASINFKQAGIEFTPTLALVNSQGIVKQAFYGKLNNQDAQSLLALVDNGPL